MLLQYHSTATFLSDVQLIVDNCYRYNPPGHWIRPLVHSLGEFLREETAKQGPWLTELDRFITECLQEEEEKAKAAATTGKTQPPEAPPASAQQERPE